MSKFLMCLVCLSFSGATQAAFYKFVKLECFPGSEFVANDTCNLKAISRYKTLVNMECDIRKPLKNVSLHLQLLRKDYANQFKPFLVNVTNNFCEILDKKKFPIYSSIVLKILKDASNINHSCPFTGRLIVKNLYMDERFMPVTLPYDLYKVVLQFMEGFPYAEIGTIIFNILVMGKEANASRPRV